MRWVIRGTLVLLLVLGGMSSLARAQSAIAGVVKDSSGAVLPGVTVEVSSPALIEGVRTATTDGSGQYRVVELRPGIYTVTFTLTGFSTVKREGIDLPAGFTATVSADMKVGTIQETLTVTGASPVVDTKESVAQSVMSRSVIDTIPTGRDVFAIGQLIPGVTTQSPDVGGTKGMQQPTLQIHGSSSADITYQQDGMTLQHVAFNGNQTGFYYNDGDMSEVVYRTSALPAENAFGGVQINMVPREGGNEFHGAFFATGANSSLQSDNSSDSLRQRGLTARNHIWRVYDVNASVGGRILRDKVWFFGTFRRWGADTYVANTFNQDGSQALDDNRLTNGAMRLTWQATRKNKFNVVYNRGAKWRGHRRANAPSGTVFFNPEATVEQINPRNLIAQVKWFGTLTNRFLLEAGWAAMPVDYNLDYQKQVGPNDLAKLDIITGLLYNAAPWDTDVTGTMVTYSGSMSYVTGTHNLKAGIQARSGFFQEKFWVNGDILLRYRNGVPDTVVVYNTPLTHREDVRWDVGVYLQDSWTLKRLTLNPGVRFDHLNMGWPAQGGPGGVYVGAREFPANWSVLTWNNVVPRFGMAYDLLGNGKTALKGSISKYVRMEGTGFIGNVNPNQRSSSTRPWTDLNGDLLAQPNEVGAGTPFTGGLNRRIDPDIKRPYQWEWSVVVDHELLPQLALSLGYYGRKYYDMYSIKNLAVPPESYTPVTITNPLTSQPLTVYNQNPATLGLIDELLTNFDDLFESYHGFEAKLTKRFTKGNVFFGYTAGRNKGTVTACAGGCSGDRNNPNNLINDEGYVGYDSPHQIRTGGAYILPYDVQISGALRTATGLPLNRNYTVGRTIVPNLTQVSQVVRLVPRGTYRLDRYDILDLRFSKIFRFGGATVEGIADLFNVLNNNSTTGEVEAVGSSLGRPSEIVDGRLLRFGVQVKF